MANKGRSKAVLAAAAAGFAGLIAWTVLSVPKPPPPEEEIPREAREMEYGVNTIREETADGRLVWELTTESSRVDVNTQASSFENAAGKYYFADGRVLTITAPSGVYDSKSRNVKLTGGVQAETTDGERLTSRVLEWVAAEDRLIATENARFTKPGFSVTADKIEGWSGFSRFRATGRAHLVKEKER